MYLNSIKVSMLMEYNKDITVYKRKDNDQRLNKK